MLEVQSIRPPLREAFMGSGYDGRQVVGMDLHRRRSILVRMTEDGQRLGMRRIIIRFSGLRNTV
jgi:hypothetical protein